MTIRLLIVEDEAIIAKNLERNIKKWGYQVAGIAASSDEAVRLVVELHPDLVLMDVRLNGEVDGIQTVVRIYEQLNLPVIYLTAHSDEETLRRAKLTRPLGYLMKPVDYPTLRATIEMALYTHAISQQLLESELNHKTILNTTPDGFMLVDGEMRFLDVNDAFCRMTGYTREELLDLSVRDLREGEIIPLPNHQQKLLQGGTDQFEMRCRRKDGTLIDLGASVTWLKEQQFSAFVRDITETKDSQQKILRLNAALSERAEENARLYEAEHKQRELAETLAKIGRALSETEHIGIKTVLQLIVKSAKELISTSEKAVIHLLDEERKILVAEAVIGYDEAADANWQLAKIRPNEGVAGLVLVSGEVINIADVRTDSRFLLQGTPPAYRSLMVAPVQSGQRKLGTISVQSSLVGAFTEEDSRLLSALGTQAAIALENAHLLESTQTALKEANALYRINQGLVVSLDPQELLEDVVELLQKNFGYYHVQIYVVDPETEDFIMRAGSGEIGRQLKEQGYRLRAGEGIVGYTAETDEPFFTNDVDEIFTFVRNPLLPDTKSELAVPVKVDGQILGLLDIHQIPPRILTQHDIQLVSAVAGQLAVALQKANLYSDLQASLLMEKNIRSHLVQTERLAVMGNLLASVSHELNNPLQAIQNALFLLRDEKGLSVQGRQDLEIVLSESERMSALIERLRATYRPAQIEDFQLTLVNNIIEDVYALIATHLRHNQISFEFHPDPKLPAIPALADSLRQVLLNLLMNAVEAMTTGGQLTVSTQLLEESREVLITVADTGPGIDPLILPRIFDAFVTGKARGTGLGLTITYDIVVKHRGRIEAENNAGHGALFKIWLPVEPVG
jgi:PAS domain S-box-containing protein